MARKTYRLSPEVEEEIQRLLRPEMDRRPVRVTLVFGHPVPSDEEAPNTSWEVPAALRDHIVRTVTTSRFRTYWADFDMSEVRDLQAAYEAIEAWPRKEVWIQGRPVPYGAGLWLPLLFFYLAEPESKG
jgi:hypothetical protein